jgi:CheY-like chemotaxis protein
VIFAFQIVRVATANSCLQILVNYMRKAKQDYATAVNGLEALQMFQAEPLQFKVIFMGMCQASLAPRCLWANNPPVDISMPVMDGLTSGRRMREHERNHAIARTRIVALTCFSSPEYQQEAALSGFDKFLIKPVPMKSLRPILELEADVFATDSSAHDKQ